VHLVGFTIDIYTYYDVRLNERQIKKALIADRLPGEKRKAAADVLKVRSATVRFPRGCGIVASRFFSVSLIVLSQGNLRRRSLQGPRSATTG